MKKLVLSLLILVSFFGYSQKATEIDSATVSILDKMGDLIGDLGSCSFNLETSKDVKNDYHEFEKKFAQHEVHLSDDNKMNVQTRGHKNNKGVWYDGETISLYSYDENNYVTLPAPETTIATIDSLSMAFDIEFPAADFFYPSLTDDILDAFDAVKYLGVKTIDGEKCLHIMATNEKMNLQLWISSGAMFLPKKYVIIEKDNDHRQFEGTFSNWKVNPDIPEALFDFTPPRNSRLISILAKN